MLVHCPLCLLHCFVRRSCSTFYSSLHVIHSINRRRISVSSRDFLSLSLSLVFSSIFVMSSLVILRFLSTYAFLSSLLIDILQLKRSYFVLLLPQKVSRVFASSSLQKRRKKREPNAYSTHLFLSFL